MTHNNDYKDCKSCKPVDDLAICKSKYSFPPKILLECGEGTGSRTFTSSDDMSFQIARVTVNTKCFNKAEVLIKFSSLVRISSVNMQTPTNATVRLKYELFRTCDNKKPNALGIWSFDEVNFQTEALITEEESFSFIFCDINTNIDCCDYFVTVTPIEIINATVKVSNGRMVALSQDLNCGHITKKSSPKPKETILKCGQGNESVSYTPSIVEDQNNLPATIAHVSLDTTSLTQPNVLIEFSTVLSFDGFVPFVTLKFELFRLCDYGEPISRGVWQFERNALADAQILSKAFDFIFCESKVPSSCCEYFVTVTPTFGVAQAFDQFIIANSRITALAQSNSTCSTDCRIHNEKNIDEKELLLICGSSTGSHIFTSISNPPFQLANINIDTTSLCKPRVNINFSSIVNYDKADTSADLKLRYELFRICGNRNPVSVGVWDIQIVNFTLADKITDIFNFTFCECLACSDCCDYFVTVTPIIIDGGTATVSNGQIAALIQDKNE